MKHAPAFPHSLLLALLAGSALAQNQPVVFSDVTVIDATGAPARPHMMVTVSGGKIIAIQSFSQARVPKKAEVVDGRGKFLIPGLWDMHVHLIEQESYLSVFLANGVTGVRVMWGTPKTHQWRERIKSGTLLGPRMVIGSVIIDGPKPVIPGAFAVKDAAEGRAAVVRSRKEGADFIKVYSLVPRDAYFAIADESKKQGMPFVGHVPIAVSFTEASDAGQRSAEHLMGFWLDASSQAEQIRKQCVDSNTHYLTCPALRSAQRTFDSQKAAGIYRHLAHNHTWQVPTLRVLQNNACLTAPALANDPHLKYAPPEFRGQWMAAREFMVQQGQIACNGREGANLNFTVVSDMHHAGVPFLAGTDTPNAFLVPGFSLHDELALFVEAGFTPMEALQTATRNAAEYFGTLKSEGTIERGKTADLVVLDANPLTDIRNTQRISGVMLEGRYFDKAALNKMLADVEALANPK